MGTVYWYGFKFLLVPALVCAAEDEDDWVLLLQKAQEFRQTNVK